MFLIFLFLIFSVFAVALLQTSLVGNADKNLASARAYAQNITTWHQAALLTIDTDTGTAGVQPPACNNTTYGSPGQIAPCMMFIGTNSAGTERVMATLGNTSPGYQKMAGWQSWVYRTVNGEGYVLTFYADPRSSNVVNNYQYINPAYIAEGLKKNMAYDRTGVGTLVACGSADACYAQFKPLVYQNNIADTGLTIIKPAATNPVPANLPTLTQINNAAAIMTRIQ